jgi:hypothetical protein
MDPEIVSYKTTHLEIHGIPMEQLFQWFVHKFPNENHLAGVHLHRMVQVEEEEDEHHRGRLLQHILCICHFDTLKGVWQEHILHVHPLQ